MCAGSLENEIIYQQKVEADPREFGISSLYVVSDWFAGDHFCEWLGPSRRRADGKLFCRTKLHGSRPATAL
jgi:hypothetical protein